MFKSVMAPLAEGSLHPTELVREIITKGEAKGLPPVPQRDVLIDVTGHAAAEAIRVAMQVIDRAPMSDEAKIVADLMAVKTLHMLFSTLSEVLSDSVTARLKARQENGGDIGALLKDLLGPNADARFYTVSSPEELEALLKKMADEN